MFVAILKYHKKFRVIYRFVLGHEDQRKFAHLFKLDRDFEIFKKLIPEWHSLLIANKTKNHRKSLRAGFKAGILVS